MVNQLHVPAQRFPRKRQTLIASRQFGLLVQPHMLVNMLSTLPSRDEEICDCIDPPHLNRNTLLLPVNSTAQLFRDPDESKLTSHYATNLPVAE
jgi:hypothetical protein